MAEEAKVEAKVEAPKPEAHVEVKKPEPAPAPAPAPAKPKKTYPAKIMLLSPFGFIDPKGHTYYWLQNAVVSDAEEVAMIVDRGFTNFKVL